MGAAPPVINPAADLPPLPPELSDQPAIPPASGANTTPEPKATIPTDSADDKPAPPPQSAPVIGTKPKKKFGAGKIIATILGIFVLVGGIGAGIITIQDPLFFQDLAAGKKSWRDIGNPRAGRHQGKLDYEAAQRASANANQNVTQGNTSGPGTLDVSSYGYNSTTGPPSGTYFVYDANGNINGLRAIDAPGVFEGILSNANQPVYNALLTDVYHMTQTDIDNGLNNQSALDGGFTWVPPGVGGVNYWHWTACIDGGVQGAGCGAGVTPEGVDNENPPNTPSVTASCAGVKAVDNSGNILTQTQLSTMKTGDSFNICVGGTTSSGNFDKAQFSINGTVQPVTTTTITGIDGFCDAYQIPDGTTNISIDAKIHHAELDQWFGESF